MDLQELVRIAVAASVLDNPKSNMLLKLFSDKKYKIVDDLRAHQVRNLPIRTKFPTWVALGDTAPLILLSLSFFEWYFPHKYSSYVNIKS